MRDYSWIVLALFCAIGLFDALVGEYLSAAFWLSLVVSGVAVYVSYRRTGRALSPRSPLAIPAVLGAVAAIALFVARLVVDLSR